MGMKTLAEMKGYGVYERSRRRAAGTELALVRGPTGKRLYLSAPLLRFSGDPLPGGGLICPLSLDNARALMELLPEFRPRRLPEGSSFGFGDRLGLATPGHVRALFGAEVFPVLAQQSVRENARTGRDFAQVLADAIFGAFQEGYTGGFAADADHLKTIGDALEAAELGYSFFTCDPSDHVTAAERLPEGELKCQFHSLSDANDLRGEYLGREWNRRFSSRSGSLSAAVT